MCCHTCRNMLLRGTPIARLPLRTHIALCLIAVACVSLLLYSFIAQSKQRLELKADQLSTLNQARGSMLTAGQGQAQDFTLSLPSSAKAEQVIQFLGLIAQQQQVQVTALTVQPYPKNSNDLGRVEFQISMSGDYSAIKSVLAELLSRYWSLGLSAFTLQAATADNSRQEFRGSLVFYTRD